MVLLDHAALQSGYRVLDIGCGTGTRATLIKRVHPDVEVVGILPDPKALTRARRKAAKAAGCIQFDQGFGDDLPYAEASFDRVSSRRSCSTTCLPTKKARRCVQSGASSSLAAGFTCSTWKVQTAARRLFAHLLHSSKRLKENSESRILSLMRESGFADPRKVGRRRMLFGYIAYFRAVG